MQYALRSELRKDAAAVPTTTPAPPAMTQAVEDTVSSLTQGLETTIKVGFDLQQALIDSSVSVLNASLAATKTAVEQWLAVSKQQQPSLFSALETGVQQFEKLYPVPPVR